MSEGWDEYAAAWDSNKEAIAYSEKAYQTLLETMDIKDLRILDFGCGTGLLSQRISPLARQIVALDTSREMISILARKKLPNVMTLSDELSESLISKDKLFSEKFDLIVASSVCSFLADFEQTLALLKSLLVPGGTFVQWDWLATDRESGFGLSQEKILTTYDKVGLESEGINQAFCLESDKGQMPVVMAIGKNTKKIVHKHCP